jgi:hypothetical protein
MGPSAICHFVGDAILPPTPKIGSSTKSKVSEAKLFGISAEAALAVEEDLEEEAGVEVNATPFGTAAPLP